MANGNQFIKQYLFEIEKNMSKRIIIVITTHKLVNNFITMMLVVQLYICT